MLDRAKPGMITVNARGARFVNESTSYHLFGLAMQEANRSTPSIPAFLICDAAALRQYGIGMVRPGGKNLEPFLADGYLTAGNTLAELAAKLGMDAATLADSVARNNRYAASGVDTDFHRGETAYQQNMGDPSRGQPNPNIGPLAEAPYYAVRLYPATSVPPPACKPTPRPACWAATASPLPACMQWAMTCIPSWAGCIPRPASPSARHWCLPALPPPTPANATPAPKRATPLPNKESTA
jgi:hypothetical protein